MVQGRQTHGSKPWAGIDPIVVGSEIVTALQTVVSRTLDITHEPAVVTVGQFEAGVRNNIIPDRARLVGTIRTLRRRRCGATSTRACGGSPRASPRRTGPP